MACVDCLTFAGHTSVDSWSPVASAKKSEVSALIVEGQGRAVVCPQTQTPQAAQSFAQRSAFECGQGCVLAVWTVL